MNRSRVVRRRSTAVLSFICLFAFREKLPLKEEILSKAKSWKLSINATQWITWAFWATWIAFTLLQNALFVIHWPWQRCPALFLSNSLFFHDNFATFGKGLPDLTVYPNPLSWIQSIDIYAVIKKQNHDIYMEMDEIENH